MPCFDDCQLKRREMTDTESESAPSGDLIASLRDAPLFSRLADEELRRIARHARRVHLDEGQTLFQQGEPAASFYLVCRGRVKLFRMSPDGNEKIIEIIREKRVFAEALMFNDQDRYPVSAAALSVSELIAINSADFATMLHESVDICFVLLGDLSQRLHGLIREIDDLSLRTGASRVAFYLYTHLPEKHDSFLLDLSKSVIAARLSIKPETFSRIVRNLSEKGIITVQGRKISVHKRKALRDIAG